MIHKFKQGADFILLDVESGAVHIIDALIFDILDVFDGTNDAETRAKPRRSANSTNSLTPVNFLRPILPSRPRSKVMAS